MLSVNIHSERALILNPQPNNHNSHNSIIELEALAKFEDKPNPESRCSDDSNTESCSHSDKAKSRKKRVVTLPNLTSLVIQNRIVVPQPPAGLYIIWMRVRFFIRPMFTETLTG